MRDTCSSHFEPKLLYLKHSLKDASASKNLCYFCEFSVSMGFMEFDGLNRLQWVPIDNVWVHFSQKPFSPRTASVPCITRHKSEFTQNTNIYLVFHF